MYSPPFIPYFVKRGKLNDIVFFTPPLCKAARGTGGIAVNLSFADE